MATKPRVSVAMPVLNPHPRYFEQAVASVLNQTLQDFELIIVEDPGERSASDILRQFEDPRVRHYQNPQRTSLLDQRNRTIELARSAFVAQLDADDICAPERLAKQLEFLESHPDVDILGSMLRIIGADDEVLGYRRYPLNHQEIVAALPRYNAVANPAVMFRREAFMRVRGYQFHGRAEDYDLWCRLALAGARFATHPETLLDYRIHTEGSKSATLKKELRDTLAVKRIHWGKSMGARARLRYWAEHGLLCLPSNLILRLFMLTAVDRDLE